ncbi:ABC transporter permease [Candidatus Woesearchaeota archaeon]|nr:ABC transporter permease [Candidatus Woesearchaeota archaeon]
MLPEILAFFKKDALSVSSYKLNFAMRFMGIFFSVVSFFFISRLIPNRAIVDYGGDYFSFVLIGLALSNFIGLGMGSFAGIIRSMQTTGTIETVLSSKAKLSTFLLGSSLWNYFMTILNVSVYFIFGIFLFNMKLNANIPAAIIILVLNTICFSAIGIMAASMILIFKQGDPLTWVFTSLSSILGGTLYPITIMPDFLQKIAEFLPITHALRAMRHAMLQGYSLSALSTDILFLLFFALALIPISLFVFKLALKKAKKDGSLIKY